MKTFRFIVPKNDNGGTTLVWAHHQFQAFLVDTYGGFTETECKGQWRDDAGKLYIDASIAYDVALGNHPSTVINKLCDLFPDQKCFAMLELGEMTFNDAAPHDSAKELDNLLPRTLPVTDYKTDWTKNYAANGTTEAAWNDYMAKLRNN